MRTTKEDVEEASGKGEQECWIGEKGCHESSKMESGSLRDCCQSGVNPATPSTGIKLDQNWIDDDDDDAVDLFCGFIHCVSLALKSPYGECSIKVKETQTSFNTFKRPCY